MSQHAIEYKQEDWSITYEENSNGWSEQHIALTMKKSGMFLNHYKNLSDCKVEGITAHYIIYVFLFDTKKNVYDMEFKNLLDKANERFPSVLKENWAGIKFGFETLEEAMEFVEKMKEVMKLYYILKTTS